MRKTFTLLIALFALCAGMWATTTTWDATAVAGVNVLASYDQSGTQLSQKIDDITVSVSAPAEGDYCHFMTPSEQTPTISTSQGGKVNFAPESGNYLTNIIISCDAEGFAQYYYLPQGSGWSWDDNERKLTWSGAATSVDLNGDDTGYGIYFENIQSIEFTTEALPAPGSTLTWDATDLESVYLFISGSQIIKGIKVTADSPVPSYDGGNDYCHFFYDAGHTSFSMHDNASFTFTSAIGQLTSIVITCDMYPGDMTLASEWEWDGIDKLTWSGAATTSVLLQGDKSSTSFSSGAITSIAFTFASADPEPDPTPAYTTDIMWETQELNQVSLSCSYVDQVQTTASPINGITASLEKTGTSVGGGDVCQFATTSSGKEIWIDANGELTFSSTEKEFVGIEISCDQVWKDPSDFNLPAGWTYNSDVNATTFTWSGIPSSSVVFSGDVYFIVTAIKFTVVADAPAPASSDITWDQTDVQSVDLYMESGYGTQTTQTIKNITVTAKALNSGDYCSFSTAVDPTYNTSSTYISITNGGKLVFTPAITKLLTKIVITCADYVDYTHLVAGSGWTYSNNQLKWSGDGAASVTLACDGSSDGVYFGGVTSIVYTVADAPAPTILWEQRQINLVNLYCYSQGDNPTTHVIKNIITSLERTSNAGDFCGFWNRSITISNNGTLTFQSIVGDITKIVISCSSVSHSEELSTGWTYNGTAQTFTWEGTANETVSLSGNISCDISSIEFTYSPAAAPRIGETFTGSYYHRYEITGAHTAKVPAQSMYGTLHITEYEEYDNVRYYITEIDDYAFYGQGELPNAYIGENIARIGAHAFDGCFRMEECIINSEVLDSIGEGAFMDCKVMAYVECHTEQPPVLGSNAFSGDNYLNHFYVYNHVVDAYKAADGWSTISSKIGATGTTPAAGEIFFYRNQMTRSLYAVTVGAVGYNNGEAKVMPYDADLRPFYPITIEGTLVISEEVTYMQKQYSITGIGPNAYKDSTRINVVLIPEAMKSIESGAFLNCTGVRNVIFLWDDPTTVTWYDADKGLEFATAASGETKIIVPKGKLAVYQGWAPAWAGCMIEGELLDVTATADPQHSSRFYRTFYDSTTDYMMPPSVWAHAGYVEGNSFILHPVAFDGQIVPKGTAVVLESETPTYRLIAVDGDAPAYTGRNDLIGTDVAFPRSDLGANAEKVYVLGTQASVGTDLHVGMGMYKYTGSTMGAHKAYMILNISNPASAPVRFAFKHENQATDIENVQGDNAQCTKILRDGQLIIIKDGKEYNAQGIIIK